MYSDVKAWTRWVKFEFSSGECDKVCEVYEVVVEFLWNELEVGNLYVNFVKFEEMCYEVERVRAIYKFVFDRLFKE